MRDITSTGNTPTEPIERGESSVIESSANSLSREILENKALTRRNFLRICGLLGLGGTTGVAAAGCGLTDTPDKTIIRGTTMGTYYAVTYIAGVETPSENEVRRRIEERFTQINKRMSTYDESSELSRFNNSRTINKPFPVSHDVIEVVQEAKRLHNLTNGALDVTVGPLVNLWGFGPDGRPSRIPSREAVEKAKESCGIDNLLVKDDALIKKIPDLYVDLSSIAKGFGVDAIAELLESLDVERYLVDVGGEVRGHGAGTRGGPWRVAVERPVPHGDAAMDRVIHLVDTSVATSGDYRNYYEENGRRYSHTIDPHTGRPIRHNLASVTVMNESCMTADGLATGLDVMGPRKALELADEENLPVVVIVKEGNSFREIPSRAWKNAMR